MRKALNEYGKSIRAKIGENKQGNSEMGNGKTYKQINKAEYRMSLILKNPAYYRPSTVLYRHGVSEMGKARLIAPLDAEPFQNGAVWPAYPKQSKPAS